MTANSPLPFGLFAVAGVYLFSFLSAATSYGHPFPLMGAFHGGRGGQMLVLADGIVSLYLFIGILKRQRLTLWLLAAYNLFDVCNAWVNLSLIPVAEYARVAGAPLSQSALRLDTLYGTLFLILLGAYVFAKRRHFNNTSPYLF